MPEESCISSGFEIIDAHTHAYPKKIALKAARNIGRFYELEPNHDGSIEELRANGEKYGVDGYLVCSVATSADQVYSINDYLADECNKDKSLYGFGALHPMMKDIGDEVDRIIKLGLKGIKLHPDFQKFYIDSPQAYEIYDIVGSRLPILMHIGDDRYDYSDPRRLTRVLDNFKDIRIIAAHLGGYRAWDLAKEYLRGYNLKFDTSSSQGLLSPDRARELIYYLGVENCFFGTDYPLWNYDSEVEAFFGIGLTYNENKKILAENFKEFIS